MSFDEILDLTADVFFILWYSTYMFSGLDRYYAEDSARDLSQRQVWGTRWSTDQVWETRWSTDRSRCARGVNTHTHTQKKMVRFAKPRIDQIGRFHSWGILNNIPYDGTRYWYDAKVVYQIFSKTVYSYVRTWSIFYFILTHGIYIHVERAQLTLGNKHAWNNIYLAPVAWYWGTTF